MEKKGAIGLSVNMIVIIIISLVVMGLGISMLYTLVGESAELHEGISQKTDAELERLMTDQGKKVAVPFSVATVARGDTHVYGLGIANVGGTGNEFFVKVELSNIVDSKENEITPSGYDQAVQKWLRFRKGSITVEEEDHHKEPILIRVPSNAIKGQYSFNIRVYAEVW